ncbi:MAG: O-antigen ligase family protein [Phycisphaerae bacterium]
MRDLLSHDERRTRALLVTMFLAVLTVSIFLTRLALNDALVPLGLVYAVLYLALAWRSRTAAMAMVYIAALFPWDVGGEGVALGIGELHLTLLTLLVIVDFVTHRWPPPRNPLYVPVLIYMMICIISSVQNFRDKYAVVSLVQMVLYFLITTVVFSCFLTDVKQYRRVLHGIIFGGVFLAASAMVTQSNYFLGMHKNAIGGALSYAVIICAELWFSAADSRARARLGIALAIISSGLLLSLSRGGWLCAIMGLMVILLLRGDMKLFFKVFAFLTPVIVVCWILLPDDSKIYAFNTDIKAANYQERLKSIDYARGQFESAPLLGQGVGLRKTYDATNVVWLTLAETGILGLAGFALIHVSFVVMTIKARLRIHASDPRFSLLAIGLGLLCGKFIHGCVDHYWSRGSLLIVWGGVGMAIAAYYSILRDPRPSTVSMGEMVAGPAGAVGGGKI